MSKKLDHDQVEKVGTPGSPSHLVIVGQQETLCGVSILGLLTKPFFYVGEIGCGICRTLGGSILKNIQDHIDEGVDFRSEKEKEND